jgi:hypothetical protein
LQVGFARIGSATFEITGILGTISRNATATLVQRAFPRSATFTWRDLALWQRRHFLFHVGICREPVGYLVAAIAADAFLARPPAEPRAAAAGALLGSRKSPPAEIPAEAPLQSRPAAG